MGETLKPNTIISQKTFDFFEQYKRFSNIINVLKKYPYIPKQNIINDNILNDAIIFVDQLKEPAKPPPKDYLPIDDNIVILATPIKERDKNFSSYKGALEDLRKGKVNDDLKNKLLTCTYFFNQLGQAFLGEAFKFSTNKNAALDYYKSIPGADKK